MRTSLWVWCKARPPRFSAEAIQARKERRKAARSLENDDEIASFQSLLNSAGVQERSLTRRTVSLLQVNIGLTCNMSCTHCHVESTPTRQETLGQAEATRIIELLALSPSIDTLDITGGAPEMHKQFPYLVQEARQLGKRVIDRCNLTIIEQPHYDWIPQFLTENRVDVVASMPCYSAHNVDAQRGDKTFDQSIRALQKLNACGYGKEGSGLQLDLVYNPGGAFLPPPQAALEKTYKENLRSSFDIEFNRLFTITNMPIKRFADDLRASNQLYPYMNLLKETFNPSNLHDIMCRTAVHVDYNGMISDCDFNSALEIPTGATSPKKGLSVFELKSFSDLEDQPIRFGKHCAGCTAGSGSS